MTLRNPFRAGLMGLAVAALLGLSLSIGTVNQSYAETAAPPAAGAPATAAAPAEASAPAPVLLLLPPQVPLLPELLLPEAPPSRHTSELRCRC